MSSSKKDLIRFQQQELNAVIMYKALALKVKNKQDRELLEELAACEGKHAAMLKNLTGCALKPQESMKNFALLGYTVLGKGLLFKIMAKVEKASYKLYMPFFNDFPTTAEIANDELRHAEDLLKALN